MPLLGNENLASVRFDEESSITTATACHPLLLHWLTAIMDFYENRENEANVLRYFKGYIDVKNSVGLFINEGPCVKSSPIL